ncbi:MAG: peroxiredoxin [Planctomycetes bacterium]|nr:peroxiredoxin [Planctomycetota bacterium]
MSLMRVNGLFCLMSVGLMSTVSHAAEMPPLAVGQEVPTFNANDHNGHLWQSESQGDAGKYRVFYFYPAAMTGGCTKQACTYRDRLLDLKEPHVEILGISADPVTNLKIFRDAYDLNFTLLSDVNSLIAQRFGVPIRKGGSIKRTVDGQEITMTRSYSLARWTFVADPQGKLIYVNTSVKAQKDGDEVLAAIKKHQGTQ